MPNGVDPLPNAMVYLAGSAPGPLSSGATCTLPSQATLGNPIAGTISATDGSFRLNNVPAGTNLDLVISSGKWRRQVPLSPVAACQNTAIDPTLTRLPRNHAEGDIPRIAIATGTADAVECALRDVGVQDAEFTNPTGTGRINFYQATGYPGAFIDSSTPSADLLMSNQAQLNSYDMLMLPCENGAYSKDPAQLTGLVNYANAGGRVYASDFSSDWIAQNGPFAAVATWGRPSGVTNYDAVIDVTFPGGQNLADWLQSIGVTTTRGHVTYDFSLSGGGLQSVVPPAQTWVTRGGDPSSPIQFTFNTPVGATNQCGRVFYSNNHAFTVHVDLSPRNSLPFPQECPAGTKLPEEKVFEFSLFDASSDDILPTISPTSADFGGQLQGYPSSPKTFTWTNKAPFPLTINSVSTTGDFSVSSTTCTGSIAGGASCTADVVFTPTDINARTGTLSVDSGYVASAALTGTGQGFSVAFSPTSGSVIAGEVGTGSVVLTSIAGFQGTLSLSCSADGYVTCSIPATAALSSTPTTVPVTVRTTSKYDVVGYGAFGDGSLSLLTWIATMSGLLLYRRRRSAHHLLRNGLLVLALTAGLWLVSGCSGHLPDLNNPYTSPGTYNVTVTASSVRASHMASYTLTVTAR